MMCQDCGQNPATVHISQNINGEQTELYLCASCAQARGLLGPGGFPQFSLQDLLAGLLNAQKAGLEAEEPEAPGRLRCGLCGLSYRDFARAGRLGCSRCYREFAAQLEPLLRRIHGSTRHTAKMAGAQARRAPQTETGDLERLRQELQACVSREDFERAAEIRDRIRELERKGK
ncbi:MAG: UvrB/UvrC motif-containing protein [Acetobacteraceae bacterium]|nr:UvrB/UvrC motif-containing protein [Acetobacteraceae bacterium]